MRVAEALKGIRRLFLDTAPVIYYVEKNPLYLPALTPIFHWIDEGVLTAVTSPVTLAECLIAPYRLGLSQLQQDFFDLIVYGRNTVFTWLDQECGRWAAELRARYNLTLLDAFQIAASLYAGCEAFLTNDHALQRVTDLRVLVVDNLEP